MSVPSGVSGRDGVTAVGREGRTPWVGKAAAESPWTEEPALHGTGCVRTPLSTVYLAQSRCSVSIC